MNWIKRKYYNWLGKRILKKHWPTVILNKSSETATGRFIEAKPVADKLIEILKGGDNTYYYYRKPYANDSKTH